MQGKTHMKKARVLLVAIAAAALVLTGCSKAKDENAGALVGFSYPIEANTYLKAIGLSAEAELANSGYGFYPVDAQLDGNKQISDVEAMITKGVKAMIIYPLDSNGLKPALQKAADAGIKVITMNYSVDDSTMAPPAPSLGQVQDAFPQRALAQERVAWLKSVLPNGGNILYMGLAFPVAALEAHANMFKEELAKEASFKYLGRVDNKTDDSEGARQAMDQALVKYKNIDAVVAYNDPTALGIYASLQAAGKNGKIKVIGLQMQPEAVKSIAAGEIDGSWDYDPVTSGINLADLAIAALKGENPAKTIQTKAIFYDKSTVANFVSWDDRIAAIKK